MPDAITAEEIAAGKYITNTLMAKIKAWIDYLNSLGSIGASTSGILNAGFEIDTDEDDVPDNWTWTPHNSGTCELDASAPGKGAYSFKVNHPSSPGNGGGTLETTDFLEASEFTQYNFGFLIKSSTGLENDIITAKWYDKDQLSLSADVDIYDETGAPTSWTRYDYRLVAPAGACFVKFAFNLGDIGTDPGTSTDIWIDDITYRQVNVPIQLAETATLVISGSKVVSGASSDSVEIEYSATANKFYIFNHWTSGSGGAAEDYNCALRYNTTDNKYYLSIINSTGGSVTVYYKVYRIDE